MVFSEGKRLYPCFNHPNHVIVMQMSRERMGNTGHSFLLLFVSLKSFDEALHPRNGV